jgi:transcriptional regulator with XRE-family HTH domain
MFTSLPPFYLPNQRRETWGRLFGLGIREVRRSAGLSTEQAARLAGIEVSEWITVEDGYVPQDQNRLRAMAAAMEISFDRIAMLVLLCREAWEL